jgi:pimeloyl-ACP methyl ester carboxylesterase
VSVWDRLGDLTLPVALLVGERDAKFRGIAERMAPRFGGPARVIVVPRAGHAVHLEAPAAVVAAIEDGRVPSVAVDD